MGTNKLGSTQLIITKRIEQLPNALDVFCKPQDFSREELAKAVDNIVIPNTGLESLEQALLSFLLKDLFVLMQQSGLNNAQRAAWGALAKVQRVVVTRGRFVDIKLEDSSTGAHIGVQILNAEPNIKELGELIKKPVVKRVALMLFAPSFHVDLLDSLRSKIKSDPYTAEISKGCSLDLFSYQLLEEGYKFSLLMPAMPRLQSAIVKL